MPINYSSLFQALAQEKENREQRIRASTPIVSSRLIDTRQSDPIPSQEQILQQMSQPSNFDKMAQESRDYSEAKRREQLGYGLAETGDRYKDDALRNQLGLPPKDLAPKAAPLENYLASVSGPEDYRSTMMQYVAQGGRKPSWYTGDYETDKQAIETSIAATMTPQQQMARADAHQRLQDLQEARQARIELAKQKTAEQARAQAAKQAGLEANQSLKAIPNKDQRNQALGALESALGSSVFNQLPPEQQDSAARAIAAKAKAALMTPEGKSVDFETHIQDQIDEMLANGQLNPGKEGSFFGLIGSEKPSFKGRAEASPSPKGNALAAPAVGTILKGYKYKGGNPADPNSWEKQ